MGAAALRLAQSIEMSSFQACLKPSKEARCVKKMRQADYKSTFDPRAAFIGCPDFVTLV